MVFPSYAYNFSLHLPGTRVYIIRTLLTDVSAALPPALHFVIKYDSKSEGSKLSFLSSDLLGLLA